MASLLGSAAQSGLTAGIGGAISGLFGDKGPSARKQRNLQAKAQRKIGDVMMSQNVEQAVRMGNVDKHFRELSLQDDMTALVSGARKAGFNPLTVLGATGGRSNSAQPAGGPLQSGFQSEPQRDTSILGAAANAAGQAIANYDPINARRGQLENDLLEAQVQLAEKQAQTFGVPRVQTTESTVETNGFPRVDPGSTRIADARITHGPYKGRFALYNTDGQLRISPPNFSPSAMHEEMWGDIGAQVFGASGIFKHWEPAYINDAGEITMTKPPSTRKRDSHREREAQPEPVQNPLRLEIRPQGTIQTMPLN